MLRFLEQENLPPYYQVKAHIILSAADEQNEPWENFRATRFHLRKAQKALDLAKQTYIEEASAQEQLNQLDDSIQEEWAGLHSREAAADSDENEDD